jgi:3-deoxy-D-manno-oct-2-ulosonic acid (Kdo) hydroxylase
MSVVTTFDPAQLSTSGGTSIAEALESNHIVFFPRSPIPLPDEATLRYLRSDLPSRLKLKNISYHPEVDRIAGLAADADTSARLTGILRDHLAQVSAFLHEHIAHLTSDWTIGTCSFRPIQERGRNLKPHASNELVHIDAGAYGATDGDRILRFFVNFSDREDRVWATKGPIEQLVARFGRDAGLVDADGRLAVKLTKGAQDRALSGVVGGLARLNPLARVLDTSPYDRAMRRLHNYMKDDAAFRQDQRDYEEIRFPPYSAWMVFTDSVSHASVSGQFAFVTTIIVPRRNMKHPQFAPFNVLAALQYSPGPAVQPG